MAKRKTATRATRAGGRATAGRAKAGGTAAKRGRSARKAARSTSRKATGRRPGAAKSRPARSTPAKGSAARRRTAGRRRKREPEDVTAEVQRRRRMEEEDVPTPPSTLGYEQPASAARTGRAVLEQRRREHTETSPAITGGDVDADWQGAYTVGDEAAAGNNPTPDQDTVDALGRAVGVDYEDAEELKSTPKIDRRDKKRWELDPASSEDYKERNKRRP